MQPGLTNRSPAQAIGQAVGAVSEADIALGGEKLHHAVKAAVFDACPYLVQKRRSLFILVVKGAGIFVIAGVVHAVPLESHHDPMQERRAVFLGLLPVQVTVDRTVQARAAHEEEKESSDGDQNSAFPVPGENRVDDDGDEHDGNDRLYQDADCRGQAHEHEQRRALSAAVSFLCQQIQPVCQDRKRHGQRVGIECRRDEIKRRAYEKQRVGHETSPRAEQPSAHLSGQEHRTQR